MTPVQLISHKRDGLAHDRSQIEELITGLMTGTITDYQMAAWLMAAYLNGLSHEEASFLTTAMLHSGKVLELSSVHSPKIDKHSTGGVGDKLSICLAPLVASLGVAVPMMAGRGLGHTGGTLDKLEAIAGYRTRLSTEEFETIVREVGTSIIGQTAQLAPADGRLYALRDVTGTVESIPLITASILSKKLAEGIDGLVLDVKCGKGAFMTTLSKARALAELLVAVGTRAGKRVVALVTDMNAPIGLTIGNALETREAIEILHNRGPADTRELTLMLGEEMLMLAGVAKSPGEARRELAGSLASGRAMECFLRMVRAHGGDVGMVEMPETLPTTQAKVPVLASAPGFVCGIEPRALAQVALELGAGRLRNDQTIDPAVGLELAVHVGTSVVENQPLALLHVRDPDQGAAMAERVRAAFSLGTECPPPPPLALLRIGERP